MATISPGLRKTYVHSCSSEYSSLRALRKGLQGGATTGLQIPYKRRYKQNVGVMRNLRILNIGTFRSLVSHFGYSLLRQPQKPEKEIQKEINL